MKKIVFFVSDEGSGHKVRQSCVANELVQNGVEVVFQVEDIKFVKHLLDSRVKIKPIFNMIKLKKDPFGVDIKRTLASFSDYIPKSKKWIEQMIRSKHVLDSDLLVTDIVEEAGVVAKKVGKPIFAISHFTWHWFFEKLSAEFESISSYLTDCFTVDGFLYPPFSKQPENFPSPHPINLIARQPRPRDLVRSELGVKKQDVVIAVGRGEFNVWNGLRSSLPELEKTELVYVSNHDIGPPFIQVRDKIRFHDYINAADLVITKGGFSTLSECLAYGTKIMIVREKNHPETRENARLLSSANRAFVCDFEDFAEDPGRLILKAVESQIDCSPLKNFGQKQACKTLLKVLS